MAILMMTVAGTPNAFSPIQLLWVNLVTDGLPATALSFTPRLDEGQMSEPPRSKAETLVSGGTLGRYTLIGLYIALAATGLYVLWWLLPPAEQAPLLAPLSRWVSCEPERTDALMH